MADRTNSHLSPLGSRNGSPPVRPSFPGEITGKGSHRQEDLRDIPCIDEPCNQCPVYKTPAPLLD